MKLLDFKSKVNFVLNKHGNKRSNKWLDKVISYLSQTKSKEIIKDEIRITEGTYKHKIQQSYFDI